VTLKFVCKKNKNAQKLQNVSNEDNNLLLINYCDEKSAIDMNSASRVPQQTVTVATHNYWEPSAAKDRCHRNGKTLLEQKYGVIKE